MGVLNKREVTKDSGMVNDVLASCGRMGNIDATAKCFQKYGNELSFASTVLKKIPNPEAQVAAKLIDGGLILFNGKDGKIDMQQLGKLVDRKNNLLGASGFVDPNMSGGNIYSNKMMSGMKGGLSFDDAEKGTIGFMSKMGFSPKQLAGILDENSMNSINGGSIGRVNSALESLQPKNQEATKQVTQALGSIVNVAKPVSRGGRE